MTSRYGIGTEPTLLAPPNEDEGPPHGLDHADAGMTMVEHGADTPMEVFSAGTTCPDELAVFVADAYRPLSSPATFD